MEINIKHEMIVFWGAFICAQVICVLFDFFRSLRKNTTPGKKIVALQDVLFCSLAFKIFFDSCYATNNGHLRWYIFASFILSAIIYFCVESVFVMRLWNFVFKIIKLVLKPFVKISAATGRVLKKAFVAAKSRVLSRFDAGRDKFRQFAAKKALKTHKNSDLI